nr:FecR family protein [uncultured Dyadobacter sp.]
MNSYNDFQVQDWVEDPAFQRWVYHHERDEFWNRLRQENPTLLGPMDHAKEILLAVRGHQEALSETEVRSRVEEILNAIPDEPATRRLPWWRSNWLKMAAMVLLMVGLALGLMRQEQSLIKLRTEVAGMIDFGKPEMLEVINGGDAVRLVNLPDGSSVVLKKNARIAYPAVFDKDRREVTMSGEAFFEVVKNPAQPFFVFAGTMVTKVKGTSFSIKANEGDEDVELVVKTGLVEVSARKDDNQPSRGVAPKLLLKPNEQVTFNRKSLSMITKTVQRPALLNITAESQALEFKRTPLSEVFAVLEEAYGIDIQFDQKAIAHCTLTARLSDEPVGEKLDLICAVVNARYETHDGVIAVTSQGCE